MPGLGALPIHAAVAEPAPWPSVLLEPGSCESTPRREVEAILRVELLGRLVDAAPPPDAYRAALECNGAQVEITVGALGGASKAAMTDLAATPGSVRARVVALTIAELVRDLDREPPRLPPPVPIAHEASLRALDLPTAAAVVPSRGVELEAFAQTSAFPASGVSLAGGGLGFDYTHRSLVGGLDVAMLTAKEGFELGTAQILLAYGSPYVAWLLTPGRLQTRLGAGVALGTARLSGTATQPNAFAGTTSGPWTAAHALAGASLAPWDGLRVEVRGQVGWVTSPVVGDVGAAREVAIKGLWISVQLGVAVAL